MTKFQRRQRLLDADDASDILHSYIPLPVFHHPPTPYAQQQAGHSTYMPVGTSGGRKRTFEDLSYELTQPTPNVQLQHRLIAQPVSRRSLSKFASLYDDNHHMS